MKVLNLAIILLLQTIVLSPALAAPLEKYGTLQFKTIPPQQQPQVKKKTRKQSREQLIAKAIREYKIASQEEKADLKQAYITLRDKAIAGKNFKNADFYQRILNGIEN